LPPVSYNSNRIYLPSAAIDKSNLPDVATVLEENQKIQRQKGQSYNFVSDISKGVLLRLKCNDQVYCRR